MHITRGRRVVKASLLLPAGLVLTGCTFFSPQPPPPPVTLDPLPSASAGASATEEPTSTEPDDLGPNFVRVGPDLTKPFGYYFIYPTSDVEDARWDYDTDVIVQVDDAGPYTLQPGDSYGTTKAKSYHKYKVTVRNHSSSPQKPVAITISSPAGDAGVDELWGGDLVAPVVQPVYGTTIGRAPEEGLRSGETASWFVVFPKEQDRQIVSVYASIYDKAKERTHAVEGHFSDE